MISTAGITIRLIITFILMTCSLTAQYWQQYVEYEMEVVLDAEAKTLTARSDLLYVNHSPDSLDHVSMHLYPNAFNAGTIAEEVWAEYGEPIPSDKGWTGIKIAGVLSDSLNMEFIIRDDSILDILLNRMLAPGDSLYFSLDWTSIIHPHIDRSGWKDQQFDFAQWYPKFVVYDENGWHDDPFGDWGEFYGEFGNFTVHLDVPADQIIGATGVVVSGDPGWSEVAVDTSQSWSKWLEKFEEERAADLSAQDTSARRRVSFYAENVHDFAWTCSPDFVYEHASWEGIDVHSLFTIDVGETWTKDVAEDGVASIRWLSEKFGLYPWPQITITKALLSGGMEYPMLIMDATESEGLIVHEIGHNWFFGIFGNDELDDAWLDEGFTSFQTLWYMENFYPENGYDLSRKKITPFEAEHLPRQMFLETDYKPVISYMTSAMNEPIATHSYDFSNYGSYRNNVYDKTSIMLHSLKAYLGEEKFLAGMQLYFDRWALKHVTEDRFIKAMEDGSATELDWFFDQWLHTTKYVDYELVDWTVQALDEGYYKTQIEIYNKGGMFAPMSATVYGAQGQTSSAQPKEFIHRRAVSIELESDFRPTRVFIDAENTFYDVDRRNNDSQRKLAWRYNYKGWDAYPDDRNLYLWKPQFGFSDDHGLSLGLRVDQVYRNKGDFITLELDHNLTSGNPDAAFAFKRGQLGIPYKAIWSGSATSWRSMTYANLEYEIKWAKVFWRNPIHYVTIKADYTDAEYSEIGGLDQSSFSTLGLQYELQNKLFRGNLGISARTNFSPGGLGRYGEDFSQFAFMANWARNFSYLNFNNRTNYIAHYGNTPDIVKGRVATVDSRSTYLNRAASSLHHTSGIDMIGTRYYLAGGGRMRAYSDSLDKPVNYLWSNNLDLKFKAGQFGIEKLEFGAFMDAGQSSNDAVTWDVLADVGLSLIYKPQWKRTNWLSTFFRPMQLKLEFPLARYENDEWVNTLSNNLWVFTLSN
ncbi:M1 family metallopeptidase [bacterium]|nr:M1 family metallopeptidase [bacterium]